MPLYFAWTASTFRFVGASTQSSRRSTVSGRMTSWYLPRLRVSRMRSATPQMKLRTLTRITLPSGKPAKP